MSARARRPDRSGPLGPPMLASLALALAAACSDEQPPSGPTSAGPPPDLALGERLYKTLACATCHGATGAGLSTAPPLVDADQHWKLEELAEYLSDPRAWVERVPRLAELKQRYTITMPATTSPLHERRSLAQYVLELGAEPSN